MKNTLILAAALLALVSCKQPAQTAVQEAAPAEWQKVEPNDLNMNPVGRLANDWMALAVRNADQANAMTIAWGTIGQLWGKPVMIVYVSKDRFTKHIIDQSEYFTTTAFPDDPDCRKALQFLGSASGRDHKDKLGESGLTVEYTDLGNIRFAEGNLCIECKKLYQDEFNADLLPEDLLKEVYSGMGMSSFYVGEIVNIWQK